MTALRINALDIHHAIRAVKLIAGTMANAILEGRQGEDNAAEDEAAAQKADEQPTVAAE